jgi:hypothetical protein
MQKMPKALVNQRFSALFTVYFFKNIRTIFSAKNLFYALYLVLPVHLFSHKTPVLIFPRACAIINLIQIKI